MEFIKKHYKKIIGTIIGAIGGYLYYHFIGCASGTCPITSSPYISTGYGAIMGYLIISIFTPQKKKNAEK